MKMMTGRHLALGAAALALAMSLAACAVPATQTDELDEPAQNRQFMALVNRNASELADVMDSFQQAVADGDAVGMRASLTRVDKLVDAISEAQATETLKPVQDAYAQAYQALDACIGEYADLYMLAANGAIDDAEFEQRLVEVQAAYDEGVALLADADAAVLDVSNNG